MTFVAWMKVKMRAAAWVLWIVPAALLVALLVAGSSLWLMDGWRIYIFAAVASGVLIVAATKAVWNNLKAAYERRQARGNDRE